MADESTLAADIDALWDYNHPQQTEARLCQLLTQFAPTTLPHLEVLTQIARAQGLQRQFTAAHQTLDSVAAHLPATNSLVLLRYLLERGRVFNSSLQPDLAQPLFLKAWEAARVLGADFYAIDAAHMLALITPPDQQLEWNLRALHIAAQSSDPRAQRWIGSLYNNIGWSYHDAGQYDDALAIFEQAVQWRAAQGQVHELRIARWCVGRTLRSLGRITEALAIQETLAEELAAAGETDGYVHEELGECLLLLNQAAAACPHFAAAYRSLVNNFWLAEREPARLSRLKELGGV